MENVMVGNATKVSFVLLVTLVVIIPCLETGIGEFDNVLKAQIEEAYKIALDAYVPTPEDVTNELNLYHIYKEKGMVRLTVVSNSGDVAYGFNCNGMFKDCTTKDGFTEIFTISPIITKLCTDLSNKLCGSKLGRFLFYGLLSVVSRLSSIVILAWPPHIVRDGGK
ncbi:hypothetical protein CR513_30946, partial [Mucuna pruriens]